MKDFVGMIQSQQARYVKVIVNNYGPIPAWHPGKVSIFADEIVIK